MTVPRSDCFFVRAPHTHRISGIILGLIAKTRAMRQRKQAASTRLYSVRRRACRGAARRRVIPVRRHSKRADQIRTASSVGSLDRLRSERPVGLSTPTQPSPCAACWQTCRQAQKPWGAIRRPGQATALPRSKRRQYGRSISCRRRVRCARADLHPAALLSASLQDGPTKSNGELPARSDNRLSTARAKPQLATLATMLARVWLARSSSAILRRSSTPLSGCEPPKYPADSVSATVRGAWFCHFRGLWRRSVSTHALRSPPLGSTSCDNLEWRDV